MPATEHADPHFGNHGCCRCPCTACAPVDAAGRPTGWCTCPDCPADVCGLHP